MLSSKDVMKIKLCRKKGNIWISGIDVLYLIWVATNEKDLRPFLESN